VLEDGGGWRRRFRGGRKREAMVYIFKGISYKREIVLI